MKNIIKLIAFIILFLLLLNVVTIIITPKWIKSTDPALSRIKGFYKEKKGTLDVIVIGNSDVGRGYSPITVWDEYGIASYNLGTSSQSMGLAYYLAKESLCYQTPNLMILDMNALYNEDDAPEGEYRKLFDNIRLGKTKIEAIFDRNLSISNKDKLSYDIIEEFKTIKEAYDYLYKNGYKKYDSNIKFKSNHYYNHKFKNVSLWKEEDVDQILDEYLGNIYCLI